MLAAAITKISGGSFAFQWAAYLLAGCIITVVLSSVRAVLTDFVHVLKRSIYGYDDHFDRLEIDDNTAPVATTFPTVAKRKLAFRMLAVDDDPLVLDLIKIVARNAGIRNFMTASSAEEALDIVSNSDITFEYFLIDIRMDDMDGIDLCQHLRTLPRYGTTPVTMLTAVRDAEQMSDAFQAGANDYITKPFDVADLEVRLRTAHKLHNSIKDTRHDFEDNDAVQSRPYPKLRVERVRRSWKNNRNPLVSEAALATYLSRLPAKALNGVGVFAVAVNQTEETLPETLMQWRREVRSDLAAATSATFRGDLLIMAYTREDNIIVVTHSAFPTDIIAIEREIELHLQSQWSVANYGEVAGFSASVGGPVRLNGSKDERKTFAADRALMIVEDRIAFKRGKPYRA